jgi:hypothetical protein
MTRTRFALATLALTVAVATASHFADAATINGILQTNPVSADGGTPSVRNVAPASQTEGCMRVECSLVGDAGVVMGIIPTDGGTFFPQANTRYIASLTTATGVRVNNAACNSYATGQGRLVNEGAVLDWTTGKNPDGGVGSLALHCCSLAASSASAPAIFQLCPQND